MIWRILLICLVAYLVYKLVVELIIPVYNTTRKIKKDFREMQDRMNEFMKNQQQQAGNHTKSKNQSAEKDQQGDYIDFEEIK
jgi:F0F1-type ATP synthase membrane subunit b/b'